MPIVYPEKFTRPEHLVEWFAQLLENSVLGFQYVGRYEETLFPAYPAALVQPGNFQKDLHSTHTFLITLRANIYIMHSDLTKDKKTRSLEDCILATDTIELIEGDGLTLDGHVIQGHIENDMFAPLPPRSAQSPAIVSTRLAWTGITEARFK
jgi:hypothetical protein